MTNSGNTPDARPDSGDLVRAAVVHDVRQMLTVITGRADLLLQRDPTGPRRTELEAIALAAADAGAMLERLAGPGPAVKDAVCRVRDECRHAALLVRPPEGGVWSDPSDPGPRGRILDVRVAGDLAAAVPGQVLREVLVNLFLNALEAMPERGGLVLSARARDDRILLRVADQGPGLASCDRERIFAPGASGHDDDARGTGLAGCRQLIEGVGGRLDLVSDSGPGARFELDLPAGSLPAASPEPGAAGSAEHEPSVLVVDDEPGVRAMLIDLLGEMGCRVSGARSLRTGREVFAAESFEVAFFDLSLPDGSGLDLAAELRRRDPAVAIVAMTGLDRRTALADAPPGCVDLEAVKPLSWDRIRELVNHGVALAAKRRKTGEA